MAANMKQKGEFLWNDRCLEVIWFTSGFFTYTKDGNYFL